MARTKKGKNIICKCGKEFYPSGAKGIKYCSRTCYRKFNVPWNRNIKMIDFDSKYINPMKGKIGHSSWCKNKTFEEMYGKEGAQRRREILHLQRAGIKLPHTEEWNKRIGLALKGRPKSEKAKEHMRGARGCNNVSSKRKGKTHEQCYGAERSKEIKLKQHLTMSSRGAPEGLKSLKEWNLKNKKGKTYEETYGEERGKEIRKKSKTNSWIFGNNADIIKKKIGLANTNPSEEKRKKLRNNMLKRIMEKEINGIFTGPSIGKNEKKILDEIERENNIKLIRQFIVDGYYVDGYDEINKVAYEVHEKGHSRKVERDNRRDDYICNKLNCSMIRVKDGW